MQKVDIAIGVLGAVALLATGLGIALYDDINDLTHYHVDAVTTPFAEDGDVPDGGIEWEFDVPNNVYHSTMDLTITFSGDNPALEGDVDVSVTVTGPDGSVDSFSETFDYSSGSGTMALSTSMWGEAPEEFTGSEEDVEANTMTWDGPLTVEIVIQGPTGQLPLADQDDPTYTAELEGEFHGYSIAPDTPDPESV